MKSAIRKTVVGVAYLAVAVVALWQPTKDALAALQHQSILSQDFSGGNLVNEFSTDGTLSGDSDLAVPTEKAVKAYADGLSGTVSTGTTFVDGDLDGSDDLIITRGTPGDQYLSSIIVYDDSDVAIMAHFTPTSTTITNIHLAGEVTARGGAIPGTWKYRLIYNF